LADEASHTTIIRTRTRGGLLARVSGVIDETFNADDLVAGASGVMVIDLEGVQRITSFGIRAWINALKRLRTDYYCLINCQPSLVSQLNLVTGFVARGEVVSFHAPFFCPECDDSTSIILDLRQPEHRQAVSSLELPEVTCPSCKSPCEFDDMLDAYFQYFRAAPMPNPPVLANALIDGREAGRAFIIEKQIDDTITGLWMSGTMDRPGYFRRLADGLQGDVVIVTANLDEVTPQGLAAFCNFLRGPDMTLYLARVPPCLSMGLASHEQPLGATRVVSVLLPFHCASCDRAVTIEVPGASLADHDSAAAIEGYCPDCAQKAQPRISTELFAAIRKLPLGESPPRVREYLLDRPDGPAARPDLDNTGTNPLGKYRIQRLLGSGGMGEVYLARHLGPAGFEKPVVIKRIRPDLLADTNAVELFLHEARLSARLSHPNVVQIFDFGKVEDGYFLTMEYVDGPDILTLLTACDALDVDIPIELCCRIISDLCKGLHAAHHYRDETGEVRPIVHRDVTPGNVLISSDGVVKLTDFGIAKSEISGDETQPGILKGTMRFIAPELLISPKFSSARPTIDIYGAGVLMYECMTRKPLFDGQGWASTLKAVLDQPIPRLSQERDGVSPHLERTFQRAVERNPYKRYQDILELQTDLEQALKELDRPAGSHDLAAWIHDLLGRNDALSGKSRAPLTMSQERALENDVTAVNLFTDPGTKARSK
jgi:eukaryotic-like serine/threonine-protein kinase